MNLKEYLKKQQACHVPKPPVKPVKEDLGEFHSNLVKLVHRELREKMDLDRHSQDRQAAPSSLVDFIPG